MEITEKEKQWEKELSEFEFSNYIYSRGYLRQALSKFFNLDPLDVPLISEPGMAPFLKNNFGYLSISHSIDMLFFAWSKEPIGIDIERKDRNFEAVKILKRFFKENEKKELLKISEEKLRKEVLKYWIIKEAAYKWQSNNKKEDFLNWEWIKKKNYAINTKIGLKVKTIIYSIDTHYLGIASNL